MQNRPAGKRRLLAVLAALCCAAVLAGCTQSAGSEQPATASTFAMSTLVTQTVYGKNAQEAATQLNREMAAFEERMSLYGDAGDIARVNADAGGAGVEVAPATAQFLEKALRLSAQSEGAFAITIAPVTLAWGVTSDAPRVPGQEELAALLPLVDDGAVELSGNIVRLAEPGMGIDLGGIAKGEVCNLAADIYRQHGVTGATLWIGGNVYAFGTKPDGSRFRIGFADPDAEGDAYIASFELEDAAVAVSGGYERYFEQDGQRYIHIFNAATGMPPETDIVSVGVVHQDGAVADFWSTTLFIWGRDRAIAQMQSGMQAMVLDEDGTLYVSEGLREGFQLTDQSYRVEYVPQTV